MTRVTDLDLERFLVDDLDDADRERVAAAIAADPALAAHVAARRTEQQAFFARRPLLAPAPQELASATPHSRFSLQGLGAWAVWLRRALLAAPAVVVVGLVVLRAPDAPGVAVRGPALSARLVVRRDAQVFRHAGEPLRAGDAVRIEVDLAAPALCSVIGVDVKGAALVHYDNVGLGAGSSVFPDALVLDAAEGAEDLIVVCDGGAVDVEAIVSGASVGGVAIDVVDAVARRAPRARLAVLSFVKEPAPH
jgi:hypothetical protein